MIHEFVQRIFDLLHPHDHSDVPVVHDDDLDRSLPWVLHIEDDEDFSGAIKRRLEQHGVAVVRAFNGMEGYRTAFARQADAILLDFEMPNGQGDYILGRLKDNPATRDIPVIVITGVRDRSVYRKMMNLGASAFLTKPVEFDELHQRLGEHIPMLPEPAEPVCI